MRKINNMDLNNTPFDVAGTIIGKSDAAVQLPNRFSSANGVNSERLARQINAKASAVIKAISKLEDEVNQIPIDEEIDVVTLDIDVIQRIQSLIKNVYVSFDELTKLGR